MFGGRHRAVAQRPEPNPVRPELVEGPSFSLSATEKKERPFDKLRASGLGNSLLPAAMPSARDLAHRKGEQIAVGFENLAVDLAVVDQEDRKSTRLNSSH